MRVKICFGPLFTTGYLFFLSVSFSSCGKKDVAPNPPPPPPPAVEGVIKVFTTTPDKSKLLKEENKISFSSPTGNPVIDIDSTTTYQTMEGWGASITGSAANVLNGMANTARQNLLQELFGANGLGLNCIRVSMGASDFSLSYYSYDEPSPPNMEDATLANFTLGQDLVDVVPVLQEIIAINPNIKITASPWSPPKWMKTTGNMIGGSLKPQYYSVYAKYFVKYIQAMQAKGISISYVTMQNEPLYVPATYPGCSMTAPEQTDFLKNHLGPAFQTAGITAKILAFDHNWEDYGYPNTVMNDAAAKSFAAGTAFHGYNTPVVEKMSLVHNANPDKDIFFTEIANGLWDPSFSNNLKFNFKYIIIGTARNWSKNVIYWNLALNQNGGPIFAGPLAPNSDNRGFVTINGSGVEKGVQYYAAAHAANFSKPGCKRIYSADLAAQEIENVCFLNPDGSKTLVVFNSASSPKKLTVKLSARQFEYIIEAGAATTFKWN
jgi:glucosylceramidase